MLYIGICGVLLFFFFSHLILEISDLTISILFEILNLLFQSINFLEYGLDVIFIECYSIMNIRAIV